MSGTIGTAEERALVYLCSRTDVDYRMRVALLRAAGGSAVRLFTEWEKICPAVIKTEKSGVYNSDLTRRKEEAASLFARLRERGQFAVTIVSEDYPSSLKAIPDPPLVLFGAGRRELLASRKLCVVGSRKTPPWAEKQGKRFAEELARHMTVVTGIAEGGDAAALEGALLSGNVVAVLANGLDCCYPAAHASLKERVRRAGLLLSEYPPEEPLRKYYFHARNRILAGLSEGTLVLSAGRRSGALITANYAAEYGRDVFAFPYDLGSAQGEGCNDLIKKGAYLVTEPDEVLSVYGIHAAPRAQAELTREEERVLLVLREEGQLHVLSVAERAGIPLHEALAVLSSLELKSLAVKAGGNRYAAL